MTKAQLLPPATWEQSAQAMWASVWDGTNILYEALLGIELATQGYLPFLSASTVAALSNNRIFFEASVLWKEKVSNFGEDLGKLKEAAGKIFAPTNDPEETQSWVVCRRVAKAFSSWDNNCGCLKAIANVVKDSFAYIIFWGTYFDATLDPAFLKSCSLYSKVTATFGKLMSLLKGNAWKQVGGFLLRYKDLYNPDDEKFYSNVRDAYFFLFFFVNLALKFYGIKIALTLQIATFAVTTLFVTYNQKRIEIVKAGLQPSRENDSEAEDIAAAELGEGSSTDGSVSTQTA